MTAPLSPAPALTAEEAARNDSDDSREHIHRDVDEFATAGHLHHWHGVGSIVAGDMSDDDLRSEHRRMHAARPAEPTGEQTAVDRTGATDEEFRARVAVFDAAEEPEEVVVERVARAILHAVLGDTDGGLVLDGDLPASEIARLIVEYGAAAALAALRGDRS